MLIPTPIGNDEDDHGFPWLTAAIACACIVVQLIRFFQDPTQVEIKDAVFHRVEAAVALHQQRRGTEGAEKARANLQEADAALWSILHRDLGQRLGYEPATGLSPRMLSAAFVHDRWLHLVCNLIFLWLVAGNLERRWGRVGFAAVYLAGAVASSWTFALYHPHDP